VIDCRAILDSSLCDKNDCIWDTNSDMLDSDDVAKCYSKTWQNKGRYNSCHHIKQTSCNETNQLGLKCFWDRDGLMINTNNDENKCSYTKYKNDCDKYM